MRDTLNILVIFCLELFLCTSGFASETPIFIKEEINGSIAADDAFFLVDRGDGRFVRVGAVISPPEKNDPDSAESPILVGAVVPPLKTGTKLRYALLLITRDGSITSLPLKQSDLIAPVIEDSMQKLREEIATKREQITLQDREGEKLQEELKRLRADAHVIGGLGRIIEVNEDRDRAKLETEALEKTLVRLKAAIARAKELPEPPNFSRRELQLTQQISELVSAASEAEQGEVYRRSSMQGDLQHYLDLIERSQYEDESALQAELGDLEAKVAAIKGSKSADAEIQIPNAQ